MGYVKKRPGSKYYQAFWIDAKGIQQRKSTRSGDERVATQRLRSFELADANPSEHGRQTLEDAVVDYFSGPYCPKRKVTRESYVNKARNMLDAIGRDLLVRKLTMDVVEEYIEKRLETVKHHTVHKDLVIIRGAIRQSRKDGFVTANMEEIVPPFSANYDPRGRFLTRQEYSALLDALPSRRKVWLVLACNTGARLSETEGLRWLDIDWQRQRVNIHGTKTKRAERSVPLLPELRYWLERTEDRTEYIAGDWSNSCRDLALYCEKVGIEPVTSNDLRRTYCSWLYELGASSFEAMKLMGHGSTRMVEQVYGQLSGGAYDRIRKAAECADYVHRSVLGPDETGEISQNLAERIEAKKNRQTLQNLAMSSENGVPRDRIELPTRGFSVLASERKANTLRLLKGGKK